MENLKDIVQHLHGIYIEQNRMRNLHLQQNLPLTLLFIFPYLLILKPILQCLGCRHDHIHNIKIISVVQEKWPYSVNNVILFREV